MAFEVAPTVDEWPADAPTQTFFTDADVTIRSPQSVALPAAAAEACF